MQPGARESHLEGTLASVQCSSHENTPLPWYPSSTLFLSNLLARWNSSLPAGENPSRNYLYERPLGVEPVSIHIAAAAHPWVTSYSLSSSCKNIFRGKGKA